MGVYDRRNITKEEHYDKITKSRLEKFTKKASFKDIKYQSELIDGMLHTIRINKKEREIFIMYLYDFALREIVEELQDKFEKINITYVDKTIEKVLDRLRRKYQQTPTTKQLKHIQESEFLKENGITVKESGRYG